MPRIDANLPPLPALRAFAAAARLGSLSHAAEELHVSKSAISHQIRALEASLGTSLLKRGGTVTRAEPTSAGQVLLKAVEESLEQLGRACERIRAPRRRPRRRLLTVSGNAPFCALWLAPRVASFASRQPSVDVSLRVLDDAPDWQRDGIDVAILRTRRDSPPHSNGMGDVKLADETVFPVASPILLGTASPDDLSILTRHTLLQEGHYSVPEYGWEHWFALLKAGPVPEERLVRYGGYSPVIGAAVAGAGIALGRSPLVDFDVASGRLVRLFPGNEMLGSWRFVLQQNPYTAAHPVLRAFVAFLLSEAQASGGVRGPAAPDGA
jgi:LysR family glycine cleavage system transcriptional activator